MTAVARSWLIERIRERSGMELGPYPVTGRFVEQSELKLMADESARALYDLLILNLGKPYFQAEVGGPVVVGSEYLSLPQDFYQLTGLFGTFSQIVFPVPDFNTSEEAYLLQLSLTGGYLPWQTRYSLTGTQSIPGVAPTLPVRRLRLLPVPNQAFTLRIHYIPSCVRADDTNDDVYYDGVNGWEEWIIWDCVAKMLAKQESDPGFAMSQRAQVEGRIRALAGSIDRMHPERAQDWQTERRSVARYRVGRWPSRFP